jgi:1-phosphofructokinase family hexose kinase
MIATVTLNPAIDKTIHLERLLVSDTNRILLVETDAGGKGLTASRMLYALGAETLALGLVGGKAGGYIEHVLRSEGVRTDFVHVARETRTNVLIETSDGAPPTTLNEKGGPVTDEELRQLVERVEMSAGCCDMFIFGGSVPQEVPIGIYEQLISSVEARGARVILDTEGELLLRGLRATPYMIKPNRDEASRLMGRPLETESDVVQAALQLRDRGIELVVISLGKNGAIAADSTGIWQAIPPEVQVVSTVGSGDSMVAGIAHAISGKRPLEYALRLGSACGAATAMSSGSAIGTRGDVDRLIDRVEVRRIA